MAAVTMTTEKSELDLDAEVKDEKGEKTPRHLIWECFQQCLPKHMELSLATQSFKNMLQYVLPCLLELAHNGVTANQNIGEWLNTEYGDRDRLQNAIERMVESREVKEERRLLNLVPNETMNDFWLSLIQLDYSKDAKYGSNLDPKNNPATLQARSNKTCQLLAN